MLRNIKKLLANQQTPILPGLNLGILQLMHSTGENLSQKRALIVARGPEFTATLSYMLKQLSIKNEIADPDDAAIKEKINQADILIVAAGRPNWINKDFIKNDVIIIDVGTNELAGNKVVGDVNFEDCGAKAGFITPVPGGVGPMTVAMLLKNTIALAITHNLPGNQA